MDYETLLLVDYVALLCVCTCGVLARMMSARVLLFVSCGGRASSYNWLGSFICCSVMS
jgi:hypothetical protein